MVTSKKRVLCGMCLAIAVSISQIGLAQPPDGPMRDGPPPIPPLHGALDADGNGEISAAEIENASDALKKLDKNDDGKLSLEELRPNWAAGRGAGEGRERRIEGRPARPDRPERARQPRGQGARRERGPNREGAGQGGDAAQRADRLMQMDADGDGKLSAEEAPEQLRNMIQRADSDGDGLVSKDELIKMAESRRRGAAEDRRSDDSDAGPPRGRAPGGPGPGGFIDRMFQFDEDNDGKLTRDELEKMAEQFGRFGRGGEGRGEGRSDRPRRPVRPE